jgi:hypothetical protein
MILSYTRHEDAVKRLAAEYEAKGYRTVVEPSAEGIPQFLGDYHPDILAFGEHDAIIVEVKISSESAVGSRLREIARRVASEPGWRFDLVVVGPDGAPVSTTESILSLSDARARIENAREIMVGGSPSAAFLLLWSTVESFMRRLAIKAHLPFQHLPTTALIKELYSLGEIDRASYELALEMLPVRNALAHGFAPEPNKGEMARLFDLATNLWTELTRHSDA